MHKDLIVNANIQDESTSTAKSESITTEQEGGALVNTIPVFISRLINVSKEEDFIHAFLGDDAKFAENIAFCMKNYKFKKEIYDNLKEMAFAELELFHFDPQQVVNKVKHCVEKAQIVFEYYETKNANADAAKEHIERILTQATNGEYHGDNTEDE